jgi:hypothetical protein
MQEIHHTASSTHIQVALIAIHPFPNQNTESGLDKFLMQDDHLHLSPPHKKVCLLQMPLQSQLYEKKSILASIFIHALLQLLRYFSVRKNLLH